MELKLRPMVSSDAGTFAGWASDPVFRAHAGWSEDATFEDLAEWWAAHIANPGPHLIRLSAVFGDDVVGYVDTHGDAEETRELGFVVGPSSRWGQGWGTLAASAGVEYGFEVLGLSSLWAEAVEANVGSLRVLERIGMTPIGTGDEDVFLGAKSTYSRFMLSRQDWARRQ
ncbi:MAG: hypothetical protein ABS62_10470 [Microbacterium sp. SCN 70-200]|uniref:GNAT family N-acetyltransferase n=1 Tax=unclassified Microbacterium TaxID=2609290 RepID=UPI000868E225|nr:MULTISPECIES: GNAT family N-acetyltransferase [unclassified Microbacterium]MBN9213294.1 GNAT family N-acetyltransferase [Microbacterium sp.]ODT40575.1 MAG: hypothetical protein ABS62_10470 [Microbacterium sp. SCN 70-200]OJV84952.1 MAG: hypothetical protein BGO46_10110 [Microbacterium sp. 70-16]